MTTLDASVHAEMACLVLMFKAPARSKQRLAERLGPLAADLAERLCGCAIEDLERWPGPVCFAPASRDDRSWLATRAGEHSHVIVQRSGNLGRRINHVNRALHRAGHRRQIFIGIDCPELTMRDLDRTAALLDGYDAVLVPASDGGVVLMAAAAPWPELGNLPWSSSTLGAELDTLCSAQGWRLARLPARSDIDIVEDLAPLARQLEHDARPARRALHSWLTAHAAAWQAVS